MDGDHTRTPSPECAPVKWLGEQFGEENSEANRSQHQHGRSFPFGQRQLNPGPPGVALLHANSERKELVQLCTLPLRAGKNISMLSAFWASLKRSHAVRSWHVAVMEAG